MSTPATTDLLVRVARAERVGTKNGADRRDHCRSSGSAVPATDSAVRQVAATSRVVARTTSAALTTWAATSDTGSANAACAAPITPCPNDAASSATAARRSRWRARGAQHDQCCDLETDQGEHRDGVGGGQCRGVQGEAASIAVARVRATTGDQRAQDQYHSEHPGHGCHCPPDSWIGWRAPLDLRVSEEVDQHGEGGDQDHADQEVDGDDLGGEFLSHAEPADEALGADADQCADRQRKALPRPTGVPQHQDHHRDGDQADDDPEHPVAEFDEPVHAHLGGVHEGRAAAPGPRRTPQP